MISLEEPEISDLLTAARAIREYCMLTGKGAEKGDALIDALTPFEGNPKRGQASDLGLLRKAVRNLTREIDEYTLTRILDGQPPVMMGEEPVKPRRRTPPAAESRSQKLARLLERPVAVFRKVWRRFLLPATSIVLLALAVHFTVWSSSATRLLAQLDDFTQINIQEEIRDLIVVARAVGSNSDNQRSEEESRPAQILFNQKMHRLSKHHYDEARLHSASSDAVEQFSAIRAAKLFVLNSYRELTWPADKKRAAEAAQSMAREAQKMAREIAAVSPESPDAQGTIAAAKTIVAAADQADAPVLDEETDAKSANLTEEIAPAFPHIDCPSPFALPGLREASAGGESNGHAPALLPALETAYAGHYAFEADVCDVATRTGRNPEAVSGSHLKTKLTMTKQATVLADKISLVNRFLLPIFYGSLGAALFCLVRVLTPALSDLGPGQAVLRLLFGAFAAMTLSMLFIPANVFNLNSQSNPTLIFLACFLFGYSFDAVLSALHRMEAFIKDRLGPAQPGNGG